MMTLLLILVRALRELVQEQRNSITNYYLKREE